VYALKAKRELEMPEAAKKSGGLLSVEPDTQIRISQATDRSAALTSLWLGPASGLTAGRTVPHPKTDRARVAL